LDPDPSFAADAEVDVARPTESPITGHITAAVTIRPIFLLDSNRRVLDRLELPPAAGADVALHMRRAGRGSCGLDVSKSFMMALLRMLLLRECQPFL
jgi:hypothetical protein